MKTILIVDDEAFMLDFVRRILETGGYRVLTAATADTGLAAYRAERPDLVVTDLIMPDKDGLELIQELRRVDPDARIVAISGGGRSHYINALEAAKAFGACEALRKPFLPSVLLDAVGRALAPA
jgi:DNA-binding NtrC family response regulator